MRQGAVRRWYVEWLSGGHLLEVSVDDATAGLDETPVFELSLPDTEEFRDVDLSGDYEAQMREAEE